MQASSPDCMMYYSGKEELNKKKDTYSSVLSNQGLLSSASSFDLPSQGKKRERKFRALEMR